VIIPVTAILLMLSPALLGGRISLLAGVRFRHAGWVAGALLLQLAVLEFIPMPRSAAESIHIGTYLLAAWFLWANRLIPGLWLVALGAFSNGITIAINGGRLPARAGALRTAGIDLTPDQFVNSGVLADPELSFLGDVFAIPAGFPLANVFSVGDVLIVAGAGLAAYRICGTRWSTPWNPAAAGHGHGRHIASMPVPHPRPAETVSTETLPAHGPPEDGSAQPSSTQDQR
jgi:hypothetical protein